MAEGGPKYSKHTLFGGLANAFINLDRRFGIGHYNGTAMDHLERQWRSEDDGAWDGAWRDAFEVSSRILGIYTEPKTPEKKKGPNIVVQVETLVGRVILTVFVAAGGVGFILWVSGIEFSDVSDFIKRGAYVEPARTPSYPIPFITATPNFQQVPQNQVMPYGWTPDQGVPVTATPFSAEIQGQEHIPMCTWVQIPPSGNDPGGWICQDQPTGAN